MTNTTFNRRLQQLIKEVENHPHREEILKLAKDQLIDDNFDTTFHKDALVVKEFVYV